MSHITIEFDLHNYRLAHHAWAAACDAPGVGAVYPAAMLAALADGEGVIGARMAASRACLVADEDAGGGLPCQRPGVNYAWGYGASRVELRTWPVSTNTPRLALRITGPVGSSVLARAAAAAKVIEEAAPSHGYRVTTDPATTDDDTTRPRAADVIDDEAAEA